MLLSRIKLVLLFFLLILGFDSYSQSNNDDVLLLKEATFEMPQYEKQHTSFTWVSSHNILLKYNPISLGFGALMYMYQSSISRHFSANCLYSPSCSRFSQQLISDYGLIKGVMLSADRIMRCNRIAALDIPASAVDAQDKKVHETTDIYR